MSLSLSRYKKMSVRQKILVIFLFLSLLSLFITGLVAFITISGIGQNAKDSSDALGVSAVKESSISIQQEAEKNLKRTAIDQANIIQLNFDDTARETDILAAQAVTLQNNPPFLPVTPSLTRNTPPKDPLSGTVVIIVPGSTASPQSEEYRTLAGMDDLLRAMYVADEDLNSTYVATDSGIMRIYPWSDRNPLDYDPRDRDWFVSAKNSTGHVWSEPYVDASGNGLMVTCSHAVSTNNGTWVIASDVSTETIKQNIQNLMLNSSGYGILVDSRGNVIISPDISAGSTKWDEPFKTKNVLVDPNPKIVEIGRKMIDGESGIDHVSLDQGEFYVAYEPVKSLNWSFAIFLPASQIFAPVIATDSKIINSTRISSEYIEAQTTWFLKIFAGLSLILLIVVILLSVMLARIITRPVELLRQGTVALGKGDLDYRLSIETGDEFEELAHSFNSMTADLKKNIEDLRNTTAEKERYVKEMEIAKEIQDTFLPASTPRIHGIELAAVTIPAMEIGGDLYDFIPLKENQWGFEIADVSGKGVSAALFMALCRTLIRVSGSTETDPSLVLQQANRLIYEDGRSSMFITVFYAVIDPVTRTFTYVNAGHNPPLLVRREHPEIQILEDGRCIALGVVPEVEIVPKKLFLEPGDLIVMYTDGVTEAFNRLDEDFGEVRLAEYVKNHREAPVQEILDGFIDEIRLFCGSAPQSDDITLIVMRVQ
jgi:sigma-B regulation protein RsbU (phosphoserine phosphatase)